ncbi:helix-turn-helix transcriptional regulator [Arenimonas sp. GDDSR-1]|uniref:helix-turn-helix domain-containing protein n=1 Tax=Arenimonas sp. GDDSR-1 TaxID=2950125 RepID=UPI002604D2E2|nr:helix-turn-helix transcriptional regulator [Arenimonas sp. GDDSR-1]
MDEKSTLKRLGDGLRTRRSAMGFSQESFADSIGMHRAYYSSIERGGRNVTLMTLLRISSGLNTAVHSLLREADI